MSQSVYNPLTGSKIGRVEPHHVESVMPAIDMGLEPPNPESPMFKIEKSYPSTPNTQLNKIDNAFGLNNSVKSVAKSLPGGEDNLVGLIFPKEIGSNGKRHDELVNDIVEHIKPENMRQAQNRSVEFTATKGYEQYGLQEALGNDESLNPPDADPSRVGRMTPKR